MICAKTVLIDSAVALRIVALPPPSPSLFPIVQWLASDTARQPGMWKTRGAEYTRDGEKPLLSAVARTNALKADPGWRPAAGKTGTAENFTNAWFVGYTPTRSTAVWMGKANSENPENPAASLRNIKGVSRVFGASIPGPTWKAFMQADLKDVPVTDFDQPAPIRQLSDAIKYKARGGLDPGNKRYPSGTGEGGPYLVQPAAPKVEPPTTTTTAPPDNGGSSPSSTTTTSTTTLFRPRP